MRLVACYILHYGREWLAWSMRSVQPHVDSIVVSYSIKPSHGHGTDAVCPETEAELCDIVTNMTKNKQAMVWWNTSQGFAHEGLHRQYAVQACQDLGADVVLVVDADEIWDARTLHHAVSTVEAAYAIGEGKRSWRVPMHHFYRSVGWACRDAAMPVRLLDLRVPDEKSEGYVSYLYGYVHHFGYAQSPAIVDYKWRIHGHKNELRPGWFEDKFMGWTPPGMDVHPTNANYFWNPAAYSKREIKHLIGDHPYFDMDLIR